MKTLLKSISIFVLCLLSLGGTASVASTESWPTAPRLMELPTPYGTLAISDSEYVYEARLQLDGVALEPAVTGMLYISYAFEFPDRHAALIGINQGNDKCPVSYRWVILKADGYQVSPAFGSCSEHIRVSANARSLTLQTPNRETPNKLDTYVFDGKNVKQRTGKSK